MATIQPMALGVQIEELYCLFSEHLIYREMDQDEWSRAVQRKIGQLYILTREEGSEDKVTEALHTLSQDVPKLDHIDDQIAARSQLAAVAEYVVSALAARFDGSDRAAYNAGVFVRRIGLCAGAASITEGESWWRRKRGTAEKIAQIYRAELLRAAEGLRSRVDLSELAPEVAKPLSSLLTLALSGKRQAETCELAEQLMRAAGSLSSGSRPDDFSEES